MWTGKSTLIERENVAESAKVKCHDIRPLFSKQCTWYFENVIEENDANVIDYDQDDSLFFLKLLCKCITGLLQLHDICKKYCIKFECIENNLPQVYAHCSVDVCLSIPAWEDIETWR